MRADFLVGICDLDALRLGWDAVARGEILGFRGRRTVGCDAGMPLFRAVGRVVGGSILPRGDGGGAAMGGDSGVSLFYAGRVINCSVLAEGDGVL